GHRRTARAVRRPARLRSRIALSRGPAAPPVDGPRHSHHLGLDVHDCAQARAEMYLDATLEPGMVFTIEPGLYFKADDLLLPEEFRGIGVRIEDDVLVTADGVENLSADFPRTRAEVEAWVQGR